MLIDVLFSNLVAEPGSTIKLVYDDNRIYSPIYQQIEICRIPLVVTRFFCVHGRFLVFCRFIMADNPYNPYELRVGNTAYRANDDYYLLCLDQDKLDLSEPDSLVKLDNYLAPYGVRRTQ